jgi:hypothetical protein
MDSMNTLYHVISWLGAFPQSVIASLWGSKLFVEEIASPFQGSQRQEEMLTLPCLGTAFETVPKP